MHQVAPVDVIPVSRHLTSIALRWHLATCHRMTDSSL